MLTLVNLQEKNNYSTDKHNTHCYLEQYDTIFEEYKNKDINILEIGILKGGSLSLWSEFFTSNSKIYGIDINLENLDKNVTYPNNVTILKGDAYENADEFFKDLLFDIVIDDGPHTLKSQIASFEIYSKKLKPNGIFVIEDLDPSFGALDHFTKVAETTPNCKVLDLRNIRHRYDDILFIYKNIVN